MAMHPAWVAYRPAHLHMMLLGFVTMMIAGVGYHVIPRFASTPLHSIKMAQAHVWLANAGLALMATGFVLRVHVSQAGTWCLVLGGTLSAAGIYLFAWNLWRTLDAVVGPAELMARARAPIVAVPR
ncbi:MAG: hypothetical protein ABJC19_09435 [Gemmatimonadota bacterium]